MKAEQPDNIENQEFLSKIKLTFLRHAEKTGASKADVEDQKVPLSIRGKQTSIEKGKELKPKQALAVGSSRDRTQETALYILDADNEKINGDEDIGELTKKVNHRLGLKSNASRLIIDERLDMPFVKGEAEHLELEKAWEKGLYFKTTVEKHDQLILRNGQDRGESTYSIQARNIAELIMKNVVIAPTWNRILKEKSEKYSNNTLERIMGTHGGISESFLAEIIDRTYGREQRDSFVNMFPNSVDFLQGFEANIITQADGSIVLHLKADITSKQGDNFVFDENVSIDLIRDIIRDFSSV